MFTEGNEAQYDYMAPIAILMTVCALAFFMVTWTRNKYVPKGKNLLIIGDDKFRELFDYVRIGSKDKKIYSYTVQQTKELNPQTDDDFVCNIEITYDKGFKLTGMVFRLYELEFVLNIWKNN